LIVCQEVTGAISEAGKVFSVGLTGDGENKGEK
jgi:hypothetical protein